MRGHIRQRGPSWELIVDVGIAAAQRCEGCGRRFWVDRKLKSACPKCGGTLVETTERRRQTQAGFASRHECEAALAKLISAIEEQRFVLPVHLSVRHYLQKEWLPSIKATVRETTYRSYAARVANHIVPALGTIQLQKLNGAVIDAFYAKLGNDGGRVDGHEITVGRPVGVMTPLGNDGGRVDGHEGTLSPGTARRVHSTMHRPLCDAVRWNGLSVNPADAADPPKISAERRNLPAWSAEQLFSFLESTKEDRLYGLWHFLAMTGCRRGEALGMPWSNVDLVNAKVTIDRH
jgi:predicted  nucleic acid-binding Zn-ribbon protein